MSVADPEPINNAYQRLHFHGLQRFNEETLAASFLSELTSTKTRRRLPVAYLQQLVLILTTLPGITDPKVAAVMFAASAARYQLVSRWFVLPACSQHTFHRSVLSQSSVLVFSFFCRAVRHGVS